MDDLISRQKAIMNAESWGVVDEYEKHLQKNVIEWLKEFPPAELGTDTISRQAAIDALMDAVKSVGVLDADDIKTVFDALPSVQHEKAQLSQEGTTSDLISRQAAIDIERNATVDTNPSHFEAHQKFTQFMDDAEISSFGRWQWSNGFNTALTAVGIDLKKLPSAQPEAKPPKWVAEDRYVKNRFAVFPHCPRCNAGITTGQCYCMICGQHIDWSEDDG